MLSARSPAGISHVVRSSASTFASARSQIALSSRSSHLSVIRTQTMGVQGSTDGTIALQRSYVTYADCHRARRHPVVTRNSSACWAASQTASRTAIHSARRGLATVSSIPPQDGNTYGAVVVGAGPAGITAVGNLLEQDIKPIYWVDDTFDGGRVSKYYREVPSNTKVKLFVDFATATKPFQDIIGGAVTPDIKAKLKKLEIEGNGGDLLRELRKLDQDTGCQLGNAADMCIMLTNGLRNTEGVVAKAGLVEEAILDETSGQWSVRVGDDSSVQAQRVVLCTGSTPSDPPLPVDISNLTHLDLDVCLSPTRLSAKLDSSRPTTVAVIGASHSAILVLMNLTNLARSTHSSLRVKWFTRHPLRYAEYANGAVIARDNTGLKGLAATWAKENLEPDTLPSSPISAHLEKIAYQKGDEPATYAEHLPGCSYVIQAIGYQRNPLPAMRTTAGEEFVPVFDHTSGAFYRAVEYGKGAEQGGSTAKVPGLGGAGIAFPEKITDQKYGHEEMNVGFFKFMKAVKKWVVAEWK